MDSSEIETLINELELRVDRLRSLFEQYFMGIEKTVPAVPQKDVERRIHLLRREQIRNTAQRFRFQMIIQRYNTYQSHWLRICRQIEEGTYKRHVQRAKRKFAEQDAAQEAAPEPRPSEIELEPEELTDLDSMLFEYTSEAPAPPSRPAAPVVIAAAAALPRQVPGRPSPPTRPQAPSPPQPVAADPSAPAPLPRVAPPPPGPIIAAVPRAAVSDARRPMWRKVDKDAPAASAQAGASQAARPQASPAAPQTPQAAAPPPARPSAPTAGRNTAGAAGAQATAGRSAVARAALPESRGDDAISDARMKQLYAQYVQTRRARNESTATITYDALAKSLRESSAKLREKHGKAVDFEVSVKDGKTVLKPVVK